MTSDAAALDRLDAFLDDLAWDRPASGDGVDPSIASAARTVHAAANAHTPDPAFASQLRRSLLNQQPRETHRSTWSVGSLPPARRARRLLALNRPTVLTERAVVATLIILIVTGLFAAGRVSLPTSIGDDQPAHLAAPNIPTQDPVDAPSAAGASVGTPFPNTPVTNVACTIPPRTPEDLLALSRAATPTPTPDQFASIVDGPGIPAAPTVVAGVTSTLEQLAACANTDDPLGTYALYSDAFLVDHLATKDNLAEIIDDTPIGVEASGTLFFELEEIQILSDGRVRALVLRGRTYDDPTRGRYTYVFVRVGDRWLIDEVYSLGTATSPTATPVSSNFADTQDAPACTVQPRSLDELRAIQTTPETQSAQTDQELLALPGSPADAAVSDEIRTTLDLFFACINANDPLRMFALFTDDHVRLSLGATTLSTKDPDTTAYLTPGPPLSEYERVAREVQQIEVLEDGMVRAFVVTDDVEALIRGRTTFYAYILVRDGNRWLVKAIIPLASRTEVALTPTPFGPDDPIVHEPLPVGSLGVTREPFVVLRDQPSSEGAIVQVLDIGTLLTITGSAASGDGALWIPVEIEATDTSGWVDANVVIPAHAGVSAALGTPTTPEASSRAVLFIVDVSGSMSYDPLGGTSKLELEKEMIRRTVAELPDDAQVGILAFNDQTVVALPMTTLSTETDRQLVEDAIDGLVAGGGSELEPALDRGFDLLRQTSAGAKQAVLLTDGKGRDDAPSRLQNHIHDALVDRITLSVIAVGNDADTALLQFLAEEGGGSYRFIPTEADLSAIPAASPSARQPRTNT